ncbi:MAG: zinc finger domain-containing protein [Balneolaceae bacterium]
MGPDAWKHIDSTTKFIGLFKNKKGMIKTALIDQRLIAGIGNECSDEILFQSGIHPKTDIKKLDKEKLKKIFRNMRSVLKTKIKSGFDYDKLPDSYIFKHRSKGAECPNCGGTIEKIKVGGRSAYYCPNCQPKATGSRK